MFRPLRHAVILAGAMFAFGAWAQPAPDYQQGPSDDQVSGDQGDQVDPPSRVARLSYLRGAVSFVPAGENDWTEAQLNRPLITGDKLWTDRDGRAELEIGAATIRVDQQSSFDFLNLDDNNAQIELTQGTLNLRVNRLYDNQVYEIDTPTMAYVINRVGEYRIDVQPDGQSTIATAFRGGGDVYGEGGARFRIEEGQSVTFNDAQLQNYEANPVPRPDDFDNFCFERDNRWDNAKSRAYVSEDVIGYQDLDDNGDWSDVPEYGNVWYPNTVSVGWTPYHSGHWGWVGAYGWTWIDDEPWGFAPFHYGRWAYIGNRWGWCPGAREGRSYYAPALVAFIGGGSGVSFSIGGPVGWFPLGPRDVYFPGYRVSRNYFTNVNIRNARINNGTLNNYYGNYSRGNVDYSRINYANRNIASAVTAVPAAAFIGARPVAASAIAVNRATFGSARVSGFAAVAPTRSSLAMASGRRAAIPPAAAFNRNVVAATKPPAPVASFASRESLLQKRPGQALAVSQLHSTNAQNVAKTGGVERAGVLAASRSNVKVVTNNGAPAHTAAQVLSTHGNAVAGPKNARVVNGVPNNGALQNHAATVNGNGNNAGAAQAVTSDRVDARQQRQTEHLQSSRFAHPNDSNTANGAAAQTPSTQTGNPRAIQSQERLRSANGNNNVNGNENKPVTAMPASPRAIRSESPVYNNSNNSNNNGNNNGNNAAIQQQQQDRQPRFRRAQTQDINQAPHESQVISQPRSNVQEYQRPQAVQQEQNAVRSYSPPQQQNVRAAPVIHEQQRVQPANRNEDKGKEDKKKKDEPH